MKKKGKRIKKAKGETLILPEELIQHIQSFMTGKEAARTTVLSKSWYNAWLTRPTIDLSDFDFPDDEPKFERFAMKTMQRYLDLNLKIQSFRLRSSCDGYDCSSYLDGFVCSIDDTCIKLIAMAMKAGATDLELDRPVDTLSSSNLLQEVFGSESLRRFSLSWCRFDKKYTISCSRLETLYFSNVKMSSEQFIDIISCCISLEELTVFHCKIHLKLFGLHKLRSLVMYRIDVDDMFFTDFASRFPCLKDLSISYCFGCTTIHIASESLQTVTFVVEKGWPRSEFDVPNIRKFTCSGSGLPSLLSIKGGSREWELDISVFSYCPYTNSWLVNLRKLLTGFRPSRIISLCLCLYGFEENGERSDCDCEQEVDIEVVPEPLVVENLKVYAPSTFRSTLLLRLLGIFRPKFITYEHYWVSAHRNLWRKYRSTPVVNVCKRLFELLITSNCENVLGKFGVKKVVNAEAYRPFGPSEWRPIGCWRSWKLLKLR